jgi:SlyX protein
MGHMNEELEERLAHLERTNDELSEIVAAQAKEIDALNRRVAMLMEREAAREADGGGGVVFGDERPPHY